MGASCLTCSHPQRQQIDAALVLGRQSIQAVADEYGVPKGRLVRHRKHISEAIKAVVAERAKAGPTTALQRLEDLHARATRLLDRAEADDRPSLSLAAIKELRGLVETIARITGELDERPQVQVLNVAADPAWIATRQAMLAALAPFPEARAAVAARLREIEQ